MFSSSFSAPGFERNASLALPPKAFTMDSPVTHSFLDRNKALPPIDEDAVLEHRRSIPSRIWPDQTPIIETPKVWQKPSAIESYSSRMYPEEYTHQATTLVTYDESADELKFAHFDRVVNGDRRRTVKNKYHNSTWSLASAETQTSVWKRVKGSVFPCIFPRHSKQDFYDV